MNVRLQTGLLVLASTMTVACQPQGDDSTTSDATPQAAAAEGPPVAAATFADCASADESGQVIIADGLNATVLQKGYGDVALLGDWVTVNAKLWVYDETADGGKGSFVWDSGDGGFSFEVGGPGFIDGWSPGVACMLVGEKRELIIASRLAYGENGRAPIPGNADIIYDLELVSVERVTE